MDIPPNIPAAQLPTRYGNFALKIFTDNNGAEHMALMAGVPVDGCLVRIHSECATGDILGSLRCDCRDQLETSLQMIAEAGCGLVIYLRGHEGRGIGLGNKIRAYALQEQGMDTVDANIHLGFEADARNYGVAIGILNYFDLRDIRLLTNNQKKIDALAQADITVREHVPLWTATNPHNVDYIATKRKRMNHI